MYVNRELQNNDADIICTFPKSAEELFYLFPKAAYPLTPKQLIEAANNRYNPTTILLENHIVGYGNFIKIKKNEFCSIGNVIVNPTYRRRGVASFFICKMIETAFYEHHAKYVQISCFNHNTSGLLLYYKLGFKPFDIEKRYTPDKKQVALIHMRRDIDCPDKKNYDNGI